VKFRTRTRNSVRKGGSKEKNEGCEKKGRMDDTKGRRRKIMKEV
jgi:hypothetical protein